jgi:hypothetical protein
MWLAQNVFLFEIYYGHVDNYMSSEVTINVTFQWRRRMDVSDGRF